MDRMYKVNVLIKGNRRFLKFSFYNYVLSMGYTLSLDFWSIISKMKENVYRMLTFIYCFRVTM